MVPGAECCTSMPPEHMNSERLGVSDGVAVPAGVKAFKETPCLFLQLPDYRDNNWQFLKDLEFSHESHAGKEKDLKSGAHLGKNLSL